ncbi:butyrate kinase [Alkaliphilus sp. B6464]|uniref:butyrate kinase n=1 Tax=Alkaliphilus sp. B6464 TaxID=2731219 RepID=UPI001BA898FD|nr:butyrate kinase [Alkaliphilus sp. B6464]QUH19321.1 butyrate kinase [Alkaliphilus sp. B6464]
MKKLYTFLIINPGSTSTKIAIFENDKEVMTETIKHSSEEIKDFEAIYDQFDFRKDLIIKTLEAKNIDFPKFSAIIGRGGNMKPVVGGTYEVNEEMLKDLKIGVMGQHASNLGGGLAYSIAEELGLKAYVVDPVVVDEFEPLARISGTPLIERKSKDHPLNQKAVARAAAAEMGGKYEDYNFIIAHLGGGISVGVHQKGRLIDVNNALNGDGPMSPERCGGIPFGSLIDICFSGKYSKEEITKELVGGGGLAGYLGTNDGREVCKLIESGDGHAKLIYEAMAYQISKEIGAASAVLKGNVSSILLTGGLAHDKLLMSWIKDRVGFLAPVKIFPGEHEMEALASGVLRVLEGKESIQTYPNT